MKETTTSMQDEMEAMDSFHDNGDLQSGCTIQNSSSGMSPITSNAQKSGVASVNMRAFTDSSKVAVGKLGQATASDKKMINIEDSVLAADHPQ